VKLSCPAYPQVFDFGPATRLSLGREIQVTLIEHETASPSVVPPCAGCHSQGKTARKALANIRRPIREWLAAEADEAKLFKVSEARWPSEPCPKLPVCRHQDAVRVLRNLAYESSAKNSALVMSKPAIPGSPFRVPIR